MIHVVEDPRAVDVVVHTHAACLPEDLEGVLPTLGRDLALAPALVLGLSLAHLLQLVGRELEDGRHLTLAHLLARHFAKGITATRGEILVTGQGRSQDPDQSQGRGRDRDRSVVRLALREVRQCRRGGVHLPRLERTVREQEDQGKISFTRIVQDWQEQVADHHP